MADRQAELAKANMIKTDGPSSYPYIEDELGNRYFMHPPPETNANPIKTVVSSQSKIIIEKPK